MNRRIHRIASALILLPFFIVSTTGVLLQLKRWIPQIQPPSEKSRNGPLGAVESPLNLNQLLERAKPVADADIVDWRQVKVIDIRPALGVARIRTMSNYEIQIDLNSGEVLRHGPRFSNLLVAMHEGSYFGSAARNGIFVPTAIGILILLFTGTLLLLKHYKLSFLQRRPL